MDKKDLAGIVIALGAACYSANAIAEGLDDPITLPDGTREVAVLNDSPSWGNSLNVQDLGKGEQVTVRLRSDTVTINSRKHRGFNGSYSSRNLGFCYIDRDSGATLGKGECVSAAAKEGLDLPEWIEDGSFSLFLEVIGKTGVARVDEYYRFPSAVERDITRSEYERASGLRNPFGKRSETSELERDAGRPSGGFNLELKADDPVNCPPAGKCKLAEEGDSNVYRKANVRSGRYSVLPTAGHTLNADKTFVIDRETGRQVLRSGFTAQKTSSGVSLSLPSGFYEVRARVVTGLNVGEETDVLFIDAREPTDGGRLIIGDVTRGRFSGGVRLDGLLGVSDLEIPASTVGTENLSGLVTGALGYHGEIFGLGAFGRFSRTQFQANDVGRVAPLGTENFGDRLLVGPSFRADTKGNRPLHARVSPGVFVFNRFNYNYDISEVEREAKGLESFAVDTSVRLPRLFYSGDKFYWGVSDGVYAESLSLVQKEMNSGTKTDYGRKNRFVNRVLTNAGYGRSFEAGAGWQYNSAYSLGPKENLNGFMPSSNGVDLSNLTRDNLTGHQAVGYIRFALGRDAFLELNGMGSFRGENRWYGAGFAFDYRDYFSVGAGWDRNSVDGFRINENGDRFIVTFELAPDRSTSLLPSRSNLLVGDR